MGRDPFSRIGSEGNVHISCIMFSSVWKGFRSGEEEEVLLLNLISICLSALRR
ncbi:hypothetical protein LguiA_012988 [Lonicera macranthoides]